MALVGRRRCAFSTAALFKASIHDAPLRSVLYVPADNPKALVKAASSAVRADCILIDLEDGCRDKTSGRANAATALRSNDFGPKRVVLRVNGKGSPWEREDAATAALIAAEANQAAETGRGARLHAIAVPKVECLGDLEVVGRALATACASLPLWAVMETPRGILGLSKLCSEAHTLSASRAAPWTLQALVAGTSDLTKDLRARHTPDRLPMILALTTIVMNARAYGLVALDGVHLDLTNSPEAAETFKRICQQGRDLGDMARCTRPKDV